MLVRVYRDFATFLELTLPSSIVNIAPLIMQLVLVKFY